MNIFEQKSGIDFFERNSGHIMILCKVLTKLCARMGNSTFEWGDWSNDKYFHALSLHILSSIFGKDTMLKVFLHVTVRKNQIIKCSSVHPSILEFANGKCFAG